MAKPLVLRVEDGVKVPFLRGILTRSLQVAGLSFAQAYDVASSVRDDVRDRTDITTGELQEFVLKRLKEHGSGAVQRYRTRHSAPDPILVRHEDGHDVPFSRGRHRLALSPCGISADDAARVVDRLLLRLAADGLTEIDAPDLGRRTWKLLGDEVGEEAARRYAVWEEFLHSDVPLLVLVGGATGTGKSTVTTRLSNRLEIVRAQSTDMLREVMRTMLPERLLPVLHRSSFLAHEALPHTESSDEHAEDFVAGYLAQVELLGVACEAVLQRAIHERVSLVMEGVHVCPALLDRVPQDGDAIVVPVMLSVLRPKRLRQQIKGRGKQIPGRRAKRYLEHFDDIWRLQAFLLSEADRTGVPIVDNADVDDAVDEVVGIILGELSRRFSGNPAKAFR